MKPGDVVLVKFPFSDIATAKKRPALVLIITAPHKPRSLVTVAMITSRIEGPRLAADVVLESWEAAQLLHPSIVRLAKTATLDSALVERTMGSIQRKDLATVRAQLTRLFGFWCAR